MSWINLKIQVTAPIADQVSDVLEAFLALSITTENAGEDDFYEVAFPGKPDWEVVKISALFDRAVDVQPIIGFLQTQFSEQINNNIEFEKVEDQDWNKKWLESFKPIQVGDNLWVCPSWCEPVDPEARNIILDPGLAFGTGTHPTTHLCLQWLAAQDLSNRTVLDYGSGTGILAIGALFSDAQHAVAVDIDPLAVEACRENAINNGVDDKLESLLPNELERGEFDIIIANILADVVIELHDTLVNHLSDDGTLLLTGILRIQAQRVMEAYAEFNFSIHEQDEWCLLVSNKLT